MKLKKEQPAVGNAKGKHRVHRGPSKADTKLLSVRVPSDVWNRLRALAELEFRSATAQAAWLIKAYVEDNNDRALKALGSDES